MLQIRQAMVGRWFFMIIGTIFSITPAFVYWLAGTLAANGDPSAPTAGVIVAFTTLQSRLFFPLGQLLNVQVEIQGALALFDRIFEYLAMDPQIVDAPDAVSLDPQSLKGRIRFRDVSFRYPAQAPIAAKGEAAAAAAGSRRWGRDGGRRGGRRGGGGRGGRYARRPRNPSSSRRSASSTSTSSSSRASSWPSSGPSGSGKTTTTYLIPRLYDTDAGRGRDRRASTSAGSPWRRSARRSAS